MIHIIGVDGVGKSTVLNKTEEKGFRVLRCPQFHQSSLANQKIPLQHRLLSDYFEVIGNLADSQGRPLIKAWALFYAMTLYSKIIQSCYGEFDFAERYAPFDVGVYAPIYLAVLKNITTEAIQNFDFQMPAYVRAYLAEMIGTGEVLSSFDFMIQELLDSKSRLWSDLLKENSRVKIIFLEAPIETILRRLALKSQGKPAEFHEKTAFLMQIQKAYQNSLQKIPMEDQLTVQCDDLSPEQISQILVQQLRKWR